MIGDLKKILGKNTKTSRFRSREKKNVNSNRRSTHDALSERTKRDI